MQVSFLGTIIISPAPHLKQDSSAPFLHIMLPYWAAVFTRTHENNKITQENPAVETSIAKSLPTDAFRCTVYVIISPNSEDQSTSKKTLREQAQFNLYGQTLCKLLITQVLYVCTIFSTFQY